MTNTAHTRRPNPVVAATPFYANRWLIREYANGLFDAASTTCAALSPGLGSFDEAVSWVCEQEEVSA